MRRAEFRLSLLQEANLFPRQRSVRGDQIAADKLEQSALQVCD